MILCCMLRHMLLTAMFRLAVSTKHIFTSTTATARFTGQTVVCTISSAQWIMWSALSPNYRKFPVQRSHTRANQDVWKYWAQNVLSGMYINGFMKCHFWRFVYLCRQSGLAVVSDRNTQMFHQNTIFDVELSNDQREFISGKKSGKINKIMKTSGAKIKFLPFSDYNFIIEVESTSFTKALDGLTMLQEELPAEISFYVPEVYHKRIIGVGGKNIQRIMKKYGVYVKFSNAEEFASLGGYYDNDDNVVARTPMKNQVNLDNLRHAVMELIVQRDKNFITKTTNIPFRIHRELLLEHNSYFAEVTKKTNTRILWPDHELASDTVTFVGPSTQIDQAMHMVLSVVPDVYELRVPRSAALTAALVSESFQELVVSRLEREFGIQVDIETTPPSPPSMSSSSPSPNNTPVTENANATSAAPAAIGPSTSSTANASPKSPTHSTPGQSSPAAVHRSDYVIPLKMNRAMHEYLAPAKSILVDYLATHNVAVYDSATPKASRTTPTTATRSASSASLVDSFSHFSNKVLPSVSGKVLAWKVQ